MLRQLVAGRSQTRAGWRRYWSVPVRQSSEPALFKINVNNEEKYTDGEMWVPFWSELEGSVTHLQRFCSSSTEKANNPVTLIPLGDLELNLELWWQYWTWNKVYVWKTAWYPITNSDCNSSQESSLSFHKLVRHVHYLIVLFLLIDLLSSEVCCNQRTSAISFKMAGWMKKTTQQEEKKEELSTGSPTRLSFRPFSPSIHHHPHIGFSNLIPGLPPLQWLRFRLQNPIKTLRNYSETATGIQ